MASAAAMAQVGTTSIFRVGKYSRRKKMTVEQKLDVRQRLALLHILRQNDAVAFLANIAEGNAVPHPWKYCLYAT